MVRLKFVLFLTFFSFFTYLDSQNKWNLEAELFAEETEISYAKYSISEIQTVLNKTSLFINSFNDSCSNKILSSLYHLRANALMLQLSKEIDAYSDTYTTPPEKLTLIEDDYQKALALCSDCKCYILEDMLDFYLYYRSESQADSLLKVAKSIGMPTDNTYLGLDISYNPNKNITSFELGVLGMWTVFQPKKWVNEKGKRYRQCDYFYPMAVGLFFVGYETSFSNMNYQAIKINPAWIKYMFSLHPFQLLYAKFNNEKSFVYRPEIGCSFSSFAVDYALNLPFKSSFNHLSRHNITLRICVPTFKIGRN